MADENNKTKSPSSEDIDQFLAADMDPQSIGTSQGLEQLGNFIKGGIDMGPVPESFADPTQQEASLTTPMIDPIDIIGGAAAAKVANKLAPRVTDAILSGMESSEFRTLVGNEVGAIGSNVKKPIFTTEEAGHVSYDPGKIQKLAQKLQKDPKAELSQDEMATYTSWLNRNKDKEQKFASGGMVSDDEINAFIAPEMQEEKYGSLGQQAIAGAEGFAQGVAGPLAPATERMLGVSEEGIRGRAEVNPTTHLAGEVAGLVAPALLTGGESAALRGAAELTQGALLSKAGQAVAKKILAQDAKSTLVSRIGSTAAQGALENMLLTGSDEVSKMVLEDPNQSVETALTNIGLSGAIGGTLGGSVGAVSGLWKAANASKAGRVIEDFKARIKQHVANPEPTQAVTEELTNYYNSVRSFADEVYGPTGIKAQEIQKLMPELTPTVIKQTDEVALEMGKAIDKMVKNQHAFPPRLTMKLQEDLEQYMARVGSPEITSGELFNATQDLKQTLQGYSKYDKFVNPTDEAYDFVRESKRLAANVREKLEDSKVWGKAADRQKSINKAFSEYLPKLKDFEKKFGTKMSDGEVVIDPGKIATYMKQLGKPNAELKQGMLKDFIDASEKYRDQVAESSLALGIDPPMEAAPLAAVMETFNEKTLGAQLADAFINKGLSRTGAGGLGAVLGASGVEDKALGALLGSVLGTKLLGPMADTITSALAKGIMSQPTSSAGFKAASDYVMNVIKGEALVTKATQNVLKRGSAVLPDHLFPKEKDREKLRKLVDDYQVNPQLLMDVGGETNKYLPDHGSYLAQHVMQTLQQIKAAQSDLDPKAPLDPQFKPSSTQKATYNRALDIAQQPLIVLESIKQGTITPKDITLLGNMYPNLYNKLRMQLMDAVVTAKSKGEVIPYKTKLGLSMFLAQPLDSTMTPQSLQATQMVGKSPGQPQPPQGAPSRVNPDKLAASYMTPNQARQKRQVTGK